MKKARFLVIAAMLFLGYGITAAGPVAKVGDTPYATFDEALAAWVDGTTLTLLENVTVNNDIVIGSYNTTTKEVETGGVKDFNLGGKTITLNYTGSKNCPVLFRVLRGTLTLSGTGELTCTSSKGTKNNATPRLVQIFGCYGDQAASNYSVVTIGENVTLNQPYEYALEIMGAENPQTGAPDRDSNGHDAYGVVVNVNGTIISHKYCVKPNGTINQTGGNVPQININASANIIDEGTSGNSCGLYASGYADWYVAGTVTGYTAIYIKAGTVIIDGATISGTGAYNVPVGQKSGFGSTGDAITMEANASYTGKIKLEIIGSNVTSTNGYAIREAVTTAAGTGTLEVSISSGTFTGAEDKGAVKYSDDLEQALRDGTTRSGNWVVNNITGGTFSSDPIVCKDNHYIKSESGEYVVNEFKGSPEVENKVYITQYTEVQNLTIDEDAAVIVQEDGADPVTLKVNGTVKVGEDKNTISYITVQPGATLIAGDIETYNNNSLRIESNLTNGSGVVLIDPDNDVTNLMGNVQFATNARKVSDNDYIWQHFGIPTVEEGLDSIKKSVPVSYRDWDVAEGWKYNGGSSTLQAPFEGHELTVNTTEIGKVISFYGKLVGNANANYTLLADGYSLLANSYTAPMSIKEFVTALANPDVIEAGTTDGAVWIYEANDDAAKDKFHKLNLASFMYFTPAISKFNAMQGFFVFNRTASEADFTIDYETAVFTPDTTGVKDASAANTGLITLSDGSTTTTLQVIEADNFSDDFEDGFDAEQNPAEQLQMYVVSGTHNLASIATNNIDGKIIAIKTTANTDYTLTFSQLSGYAYALTDISGATEKEVEVSEGGTYTFTAPANQTVQYFRLGEGTVDADEAEATELNFWVNENTLYVAGAESDIVVYNAAGVKVAAANADGNAIQAVNIASLANGLYIVESGALTGKFIK